MVTNEMLELASQIVEAQKNAKIELVHQGLVQCTDSFKGKVKLIPLEKLTLNDTTVGVWVMTVNDLLELHRLELAKVTMELAMMKSRVDALETNLARVVDHIDNEGDPLASDTLHTTDTVQGGL